MRKTKKLKNIETSYSRFQRFVSMLLIVLMLWGISFRVPKVDYETYASNTDFFNLVSIIVDESIYGAIKSELGRYSKDIQWVLENTKVVILPTPKDASAFQIASLNESLYFEWYKWVDDWVDFESKLVGTVLVWDFELPVAYKNNNLARTILPFTDFVDKEYIYDHETDRYEENENNIDGIKSEIWHGVISPNLWSTAKNLKGYKDYFDKNHDFYTGQWLFQKDDAILNWVLWEKAADTYEPYVFYYDQFREEKALNTTHYLGYKGYRDNLEDIIYNRFSTKLADKLSQSTLRSEDIKDLLNAVWAEDKYEDMFPNTYNVPDIQTRHITKNVIKEYVEVFAKWVLWDFRKDVHNAWRYNDVVTRRVYGETTEWKWVNVDLVPYLISVLDIVTSEYIKWVNDDIEGYIDNRVINNYASDIIIPVSYSSDTYSLGWWDGGDSGDGGTEGGESEKQQESWTQYINYLFWKNAGTQVTRAHQCSIYLWSMTDTTDMDIDELQKAMTGTLVEANRWLNIENIQPDFDKLKALWIAYCPTMKWTEGYWWGNSPINLDQNKAGEWELALSTRATNRSIIDLFDVKWSKEIFDPTKTLNPLQCYDTNFIKVFEELSDGEGGMMANYKVWPNPETWKCETLNTRFNLTKTYNQLLWENCTMVYLDWVAKHSFFLDDECSQIDTYHFKTIPSYIMHKSPTSYELTEEISSMVTPNLPIDRDRYIDFIWNGGVYEKIYYPNMFRVDKDFGSIFTHSSVEAEFQPDIDRVNEEIKKIDQVHFDIVETAKEIMAEHDALQEANNDVREYNDGEDSVWELVLASIETLWDDSSTLDQAAKDLISYRSQFETLKEDISDLLVDIHNASHGVTYYQYTYQRYNALVSYVNELGSKIDSFEAAAQNMKTQAETIKSKSFAIQQETANIKEKTIELQEASEIIQDANAEIKTYYDALNTFIDYIESKKNETGSDQSKLIAHLSAKIEEFKTVIESNDAMTQEITSLISSNEKIIIENEKIITENNIILSKYQAIIDESVLNISVIEDMQPIQSQMRGAISTYPKNWVAYYDINTNTLDQGIAEIELIHYPKLSTLKALNNGDEILLSSPKIVDSSEIQQTSIDDMLQRATTIDDLRNDIHMLHTILLLAKRWGDTAGVIDTDNALEESTSSFFPSAYANAIWVSVDTSQTSATFDLEWFLRWQSWKTFTIDGESKTLDYYDTLVFALYWKNISTSAKYGFIFDHYLTDQFAYPDHKAFLPKNKKLYEISYIGAEWDAQNMFVKVDPEWKLNESLEDIKNQNRNYVFNQMINNISSDVDQEAVFDCAPPDWVPIWEWIPAVTCWLQNMMPPSIWISDGICGPSLLSDEEQEELEACNGDVNKNGVNDCLENKIWNDGSIELISDSEKYFYNKTAQLKAKIKDKDGNLVKFVNNTNVSFELVKIVDVNDNNNVVFDAESDTLNDTNVVSQYLTFRDITVRAQWWEAQYWFATKSLDANVYFRAVIDVEDSDGNNTIHIESDTIEVKIRWERLFNSSYKFIDGEFVGWLNGVKVSDQTNVYIMDGTNQSISDVTNIWSSNEKLVILVENHNSASQNIALNYPLEVNLLLDDEVVETKIIEQWDLSNIQSLFAIQTSGSYSLKIKDSQWFQTIRNLELIPETPSRVEFWLGSTVLEAWNNISTNFVTIYDRYGNPTSGEFYDIELDVDGGSLNVYESKSDQYKVSTFEWYKVFRLISWEEDSQNTITARIYDLQWNKLVEWSTQMRVEKDIVLVAKPLSTNFMVWWNTYRYEISARSSDGSIISDFQSRAYLIADPWFLVPTQAYFEMKDGVSEIEFKTKTVATQGLPIEFQVEGINDITKKDIVIYPDEPVRMEMNISKSKIEAVKENRVEVNVELRDKYNNFAFNAETMRMLVVEPAGTDVDSPCDLSMGCQFVSGRKVFWVELTDDVPRTFNIIAKIQGLEVPKNAVSLESFYFWNKSRLQWHRYNSLYTTLLWSNYWDIDQTDYLAGSLLFERNNRSIAVTSLLNNPYKYDDVVTLGEKWWLQIIHPETDLSQDIVLRPNFIDEWLSMSMHNDVLNTFIGNINYNFPNSIDLKVCVSWASCEDDMDDTGVFLQSFSSDYSIEKDGGLLLLKNKYEKTIFEVTQNGEFHRYGSLAFEFDDSSAKDYLSIYVQSGWENIAKLWIIFVDAWVVETTQSEAQSLSNSIEIILKTDDYGIYEDGVDDLKRKTIFYRDPFTMEYTLDAFSRDGYDSAENFIKQSWVGWKDGNKSLLEFAAWSSVGQSVANYMSFSVVNLWDPVLKLKKVWEKETDGSMWMKLTQDDNIDSYKLFDYNNDNKQDILLIKNDNYFKLLEQKDIDGDYLDMWNLAFIPDLGAKDLVEVWDFTGDGYDDIFFVNNKSKPYLLNNVGKNFDRISLEDEFDVSGHIVRAEWFDMDNDGKGDIVILDDLWEISIFYGNGTSEDPQFTKKRIAGDYGVRLSWEPRNDNALVYFKWLYQPTPTYGDNSRVDNYLFVSYPYTPNSYEYWDGQDIPDNRENTFLLKSDYAQEAWLKVEKIFSDKNGWVLSTGDIVEVEVTLTNVSDETLEEVVYAEKVSEVFTLNEKSLKSTVDFNGQKWFVWYGFLIDGFDIWVGQSMTFTYEAKTRPLKYSIMEVWLLENWEAWDDSYWDIALKPDELNCAQEYDIFRSWGPRTYSEWTQTPQCSASKIRLPEELQRNIEDLDGNGVPDYIDELLIDDVDNPTQEEMSNIQQYGQQQLSKLHTDTDGDGLPDAEDHFNMDYDVTLDIGIESNDLELALDDLENIIQWLQCGFGDSSCFASPLNWAPLSAWNDPVFMWKLVGDGLKVWEWIPVFSALTWIKVGKYCVPTTWPVSPKSVWCSWMGAWGYIGTNNPTNFVRIFVTPTLTGWLWVAACFGAPASVVGNSIPEWLAPFMPGGNCVIMTTKFFWCPGDGSEGDPGSMWLVKDGIINGNCNLRNRTNIKPKKNEIKKYFEDGEDGVIEEAFEFLPGNFSDEPEDAMFSDGKWADISVSLDVDSLEAWNFEDIIKIQQTRISPFPSWFMDWLTRQVEEIANKLTDFPTLFVVLPDFTGAFDADWWDVNPDSLDFLNVDSDISSNETVNKWVKQVSSWIKEAYEFISSTPAVFIEQETVDMTIPWISQGEIAKTISSRETTISQREKEISRAKNDWTDIDWNVGLDTLVDLEEMLDSLRNNVEVIKSYRETPEKINSMLNKKEEYLEQILCNIDTVSSMLWGRIWKNGERFEAWVKTFILIKSILKSWQVLVDIFYDYDLECHDCKNERQDGLEEEFSLVDLIVPKIPVIRFPKWPDIVLDLHNISAGLTVTLPEYDIDSKPILLPTLPELNLPDAPDINALLGFKASLPTIPVLPEIEIPELPDIPTLPSLDLPDLPPPPKLPSILPNISAVANIWKLILKAMCILKSSPLHPEWRAGDQIAFLTERAGYLWTDFFEVTLPEITFPFVDAISVSSFVDMQYEADFLVEMARQVANPINSLSNDFTNIFDVNLPNLDLRDASPIDDINIEKGVEINEQWVSGETSMNIEDKLVSKITHDLTDFIQQVDETKDIWVGPDEFLAMVNASLLSTGALNDPEMAQVKEIWDQVNKMTYSKEKKLVADLQESNSEKFDTLKDIINTEIIRNKDLKKKIHTMQDDGKVTRVSSDEDNERIDYYNEQLAVYNNKFVEAAKNLVTPSNSYEEDLRETAQDLMTSIQQAVPQDESTSSNNTTWFDRSLLAATTNGSSSSSSNKNACQLQAESDFWYDYKWIYLITAGKSARLFDYIDNLSGTEVAVRTQDSQYLYLTHGELFKVTTRSSTQPEGKVFVTDNPIVLSSSNNKFYNDDVFHEAVNNAYEYGSDTWYVNIWFSAPTDRNIHNFRLRFYDLVDKFLNIWNTSYQPEWVVQHIVDAISDISNVTIKDETDTYVLRDHVAYISQVGDLRGVSLTTTESIDIRKTLENDQVVTVSEATKLYSWDNAVTITYYTDDDKNDLQSISIPASSNIEMKDTITIVWVNASVYLEGNADITYEAMDILEYQWMNLFPGSKIIFEWNQDEISGESYLEVRYYDDSITQVDFDESMSWEIYDLWYETADHYIRVQAENDFYYSKLSSFKNNIESTLSRQIVLAPQVEADNNPPEISWLDIIRVPVYQTSIVDLTNYIYEDLWVKNIDEVQVDIDISTDSDGNGNTKDDNDSSLVSVIQNPLSIKLEIWEFDELFKRDIRIMLTDKNWNQWYKDIPLEVYSPTPEIQSFRDGMIEWWINENLTDEPVRLYRYRWWVITKLEDTSWDNITQTTDGSYTFQTQVDAETFNKTGLELYQDWQGVASVDESTWKITLKDTQAQIEVFASNHLSNDWVYPKVVVSKDWVEMYFQYLSVANESMVEFTNWFDTSEELWIYFSFTDTTHYNYYSIPEWVEYNPWVLSIYRNTNVDKESLFTIFPDGRIFAANEKYSLEYDTYDQYIVIKLIDNHFKREVWKVLYMTQAEYVIQ